MLVTRVALLCAALALCGPPPPARAGVFEGWRHSTEAVGARDATRIAWIDQTQGRTVLYAADAPSYRPEVVARSEVNDGVPIEALSISADGRWLAYDRGGAGDAAGRGETGARGVWLAGPNGAPCRLGDGARPSLSPRADRLAWLSQGRLMTAPLMADCAATQAAAVEIARDGVLAPLWSPDGAKLAFEQTQGRARRIGIWSEGTQQDSNLRWIANGAALDVAPAWSPDGRQIAFLRLDATSDDLANQYDEDPPARFAVMVLSLAEPAPNRLWTSPGADGFARQWRSRSTAPILWLDGRRLAFLSEHQGWQHFYSIALSGGAVRDLTPGRCETEYGDIARLALITSDACAQVDLRRLVRLDLKTGKRLVLTSPQGVAIQPQAFNHGRNLIWRESEGQVMSVRLLIGAHQVRPEPAVADPFPGVATRSIGLRAQDGLRLNAQLFSIPSKVPRPAVIFLHGGPQQQSLAAASPSSFYARFGWMNRALAAQGYQVLSLNYRSGRGQGRDFRRIRGVAREGARELKDVEAARDWLVRQQRVDPTRIAVWGDSWGGWLSALALARRSDLFAGGVVISGVYDLSETSFGPTLPAEARSRAQQSSAAGWIDQWRAPVLIVHGEKDLTVPFAQGREMSEALKARGRDATFITYPREGHVFQIEQDWDSLYDASAAFFARLFAREKPDAKPRPRV